MSYTHLKAVEITILLYGGLAAAYFGWGKAFIWAAAPTGQKKEPIPITLFICTGWAFTLFVFQCIHFFFPITVLSVGPVFIFGIAISVVLIYREHKYNTQTSPFTRLTLAHATMATVVLLLSGWVASRSMLHHMVYDSGLYHLNIVRWTNSFPIVPGLGNLHGRLAFNQSFFTYVAALNLYPLFGHGRSVANSFLLLLAFVTVFEMMLPVLRRRSLAFQLHPLQWCQALLCVPLLGYWTLSSRGLFSPSPDLASSLLQVIIFVIFVRAVSDVARDRPISLGYSTILTVLAVTSITVKLSNVAFSGVVMVLTLIGALKRSETRIRDAIRICLPGVLILLIMCLRGVTLSGAPMYPSTLGYVHTDWSVPLDKVISERNYVYSWARQPKTYWGNVLGNWNWLTPWLERVAKRITVIVYPLLVSLGLSIITVFVSLFSVPRSAMRRLVHCIVVLPLLCGLVFWFFTAPDPRFAHALFMLLPVSVSLILMARIHNRVKGKTFGAVICVLFVVSNLSLVSWAYRNRRTIKDISYNGWQPTREVPLVLKVTKSGLAVYTPVTGDQCWDAPIPCTPYFNENLRLIDPADMSAGFTVVPLEDDGKNAEQGAPLDGDSATVHPRQ